VHQVDGIMDALSHDEALAAEIHDDLVHGGGGRASDGLLDSRAWEDLRRAFLDGHYVLAPLVGRRIPDDPYPDAPDGEQPTLFTLSQQGIDFLVAHERMMLRMYNDPANHCTIGIGHLVHLGPINGTDSSEKPFANGITREQAMNLFQADIAVYAAAVSDGVMTRLNQYWFDALVSFCFNIGVAGFKGSGVLKRLNAWKFDEVPDAMMQWNKPAMLIGRRSDEARLFRTGRYR
jgi:GH24 family phage-related lysozyme (muramidase)